MIGRLLELLGIRVRRFTRRRRPSSRPANRRTWGKGTGRPSYAVVQWRRAANRRARASRRINRSTR